MNKTLKRFLVKSKLFLPIGIAIILSILTITWQSINISKKSIYNLLEKNLLLEVESIKKMLEREKSLKLEKVKTHLKYVHHKFYSSELNIDNDSSQIEAINQITGLSHKVWVKNWLLDSKKISEDFSFVDKIKDFAGGTATIFQRIDSGFIRISTNVLKIDSSRAINTFIPNNSPVIQAIEKGDRYFGRAFVVNDWYIAAYEPITINGKVAGILYVGNKEKDLNELQNVLNDIKIGESGALYILDNKGNTIISSGLANKNGLAKEFLDTILREKNGKIRYTGKDTKLKQIIAFTYFGDFELYVVAYVSQLDETQAMIQSTVKQSVTYGVIIFILLSLFVFFLTSGKLHKYLKQIEDSNKKLRSAREALEHSENKFQTIFYNSSDEVFVTDFQGNFIELNQPAYENLEFTREELLKIKFFDITSKKYREFVSNNLKVIIEKGFHTYETEHLSKNGDVISYEMKSKVIEYEGKKVVLSIARNISERKALEKKIVQTIIETEMKERKRFSADLHDGLGPILSAIKLYSDLIKKGNFNKISLEEAVSNIDELVEMAIASAKEISNNITPNVLDDFGLAVAISEFCSYVKRSKSINIDVDTSSYLLTKSGIETTILYQTVKELINNTLKHAHAKNIRIQLKNIGNQIILYYRDDGAGFDLEEKLNNASGLGLNNIINKLKTIKGTCDFNSRKGKGMFIIISVKIEEEKTAKSS